jgi:hypothetical protein
MRRNLKMHLRAWTFGKPPIVVACAAFRDSAPESAMTVPLPAGHRPLNLPA